jgi:hypothetical protein
MAGGILCEAAARMQAEAKALQDAFSDNLWKKACPFFDFRFQ